MAIHANSTPASYENTNAPAGLASGLNSAFTTAFTAYRVAHAHFMRDDLPEKAGIAALHASDDAFHRVLEAPSATIGDIATKLETYLVEYEGSSWDSERLALIAADARRLADREA